MQKRTWAIAAIIGVICLVAACKKDTKPAAPQGNVQHAITDTFYWRAKLDTTWVYHGDNNKSECNGSTGLCSSFLYDATFKLIDSANPYPHDSIIRTWVGKTFHTSNDSASKAYLFTFSYPDSLNRTVSTEYTSNYGSSLTITSITANGHSTLTTPDSPALYYNLYKVKGTFNVNLSRFQDTNIVHLTQGDFQISVMESTHQ